MSAIVRDHRTLRGMEIQGFIIRRGTPRTRERHWTGLYVREYRVKEGPKLENWYTPFEYRGKTYRIEYFDGSFYPFVVELGNPNKPAFV